MSHDGGGQPRERPVAHEHALRAMEAIDHLVITWDDTGRITYLNRRGEELLGRNRQAILGRPVEEVVRLEHEAQEGPLALSPRTSPQGSKGELGHLLLVTPTCERLPVHGTLFPLALDGGEPGGVLLLRGGLQTAPLQRYGADLWHLLDSVADGVYVIDRADRCTYINAAAQEMLGYRAQEVLGRAMHALIHHTTLDGKPYPKNQCPIHHTRIRGETCWVDHEAFWHRDGTRLEVEYSASPVYEGDKVVGAITVFRDTSRLRALTRELDYLSSHDPLTGLINRREFDRRLQNALADAHTDQAEHVLCYLDLDQFKVVNDNCGHAAGDEMLRQMAHLMQRHIRRGDLLARLGGDEFALLLFRCPMEDAMEIARGLHHAVNQYRFLWESTSYHAGVSIGLVSVTGETPSTGEALGRADAACYLAKEGGRNRCHVYQPDDGEALRRQGDMRWVARIQQALDDNQLVLRCQPFVHIRNREPEALNFEVLLSLREGDGTLVAPGAFLSAAERYGLMPKVDRWVVTRTLEFLRERPQLRRQLHLCSVNLSGHTLGDETFTSLVEEALADSGLAPEKMLFEVTENSAITNLSAALSFMERLGALGCRFALDDFGSGMSSFSYLKSLPVDFLKIDGSFVRRIHRDPVDRAMVEAIQGVARVMGIQTIAEFVEDWRVWDRLEFVGVDFAQGHLVGRPRPLEEMGSR